MKFLRILLILLALLGISLGILSYPVESDPIHEILTAYDEFLPGNAIPISWNCNTFYDSYMHFYCVQKTEELLIFVYGANNQIEYTHFTLSEGIPLGAFVSSFGHWSSHVRYSKVNYWTWERYQLYARTVNIHSSLFTPIYSLKVNL